MSYYGRQPNRPRKDGRTYGFGAQPGSRQKGLPMTIRGGGDPSRNMVQRTVVRMGPPPRSLAAEANGCFMVGIRRRSNRIQGCGAMLRAQRAGSPRFVLRTGNTKIPFTIRGGGDPSRNMVQRTVVRMGPLPRSVIGSPFWREPVRGDRQREISLTSKSPYKFWPRCRRSNRKNTSPAALPAADAAWIMLNEVMPPGPTPHSSPSR